VLGFQDETWWTRLAQPGLFAWAAADPLRLGANAKDPKGGGPEAIACYGVLRLDTGGINYLVMGPWNHGGWSREGRTLGNIDFGSATGQ